MSKGTVAMGLLRLKFQNGLPNAVKSMGAASPSTLETANTTPVRRAREETGKTTHRIVRHFGTPRARAASRREAGTSRKASWALIKIMGIMMKAYATEPERPEKLPKERTTSA